MSRQEGGSSSCYGGVGTEGAGEESDVKGGAGGFPDDDRGDLSMLQAASTMSKCVSEDKDRHARRGLEALKVLRWQGSRC